MAKLGAYGYILWGETYDLPYVESIRSLLPAVKNYVILTDPRFKDGTIEKLEELRKHYPDKIHLIIQEIDLNNPGVDGATKTLARSYCDADIKIQVDVDEIFREEDIPKIIRLGNNWRSGDNIVGTGVVNWFNGEHFKMSAAGWDKARFSLNNSHFTHGIPLKSRIPRGQYCFAKEDTDGAGYVEEPTGISLDTDRFLCDSDDFPSDFFNPESIWIHHYSWYSIIRKWRMKPTWHYFWGLLYGQYNNLEDYTIDRDGEVVDFWHPAKNWKKPEGYIPGIVDEMSNRRMRGIKSNFRGKIPHPPIMNEWLARQKVYYPKRFGIIPERRCNI